MGFLCLLILCTYAVQSFLYLSILIFFVFNLFLQFYYLYCKFTDLKNIMKLIIMLHRKTCILNVNTRKIHHRVFLSSLCWLFHCDVPLCVGHKVNIQAWVYFYIPIASPFSELMVFLCLSVYSTSGLSSRVTGLTATGLFFSIRLYMYTTSTYYIELFYSIPMG